MAYDPYRPHQSDSHHHFSPNPYDQTHDSRPYHSYNPPGHYPQEPSIPPRASSPSRSDGSSQQPLNDALRNAFNKSDAARTLDPDLIAELTAQVKKSVLDEIKLNGVGTTAQNPPPAPQYVPQSPTSTSTSIPSRNVYTPPSPRYQDYSSRDSHSPDYIGSFDGTGETQTPRYGGGDSYERQSRPAPVQRASTDGDFTPIEKMWQRLFTSNGNPTPRLGQFLRGLAVHLVCVNSFSPTLMISIFRNGI